MFAQESVMDIQKEREAFENWWEGFHNGRQIACDYVEEDNSYSVGYANAQWVAWQAAKAQAVPEGFVLIADNSKTVVAIEKMIEQQVEASGITQDVFRLDGHRILEAMIEAQEQSHD
ncbi:hypothetical protein [Acinetobacter guillouiae]|uniref:hypothetical protein n=1 Tax=Acinetobacter guillouiae TaxID=106649 RepID=UPI003AF487F8